MKDEDGLIKIPDNIRGEEAAKKIAEEEAKKVAEEEVKKTSEEELYAVYGGD